MDNSKLKVHVCEQDIFEKENYYRPISVNSNNDSSFSCIGIELGAIKKESNNSPASVNQKSINEFCQ